MTVEAASYISQLNPSYPADADNIKEGGGPTNAPGSAPGHINMIKTVLQTQFSGLSGATAVTADESELNLLDGKTAIGDALLGTLQTWTKAQIPSTETATISTSKTLDFDTYQNFILTLGSGANTLSNPTTEASNVGQTGVMIFIQPSTGAAGTVSLAADYESIGGSGITLSSTSSQYDVVPYMIKATDSVLVGSPQLNFS